ncbi:hypothetical protein VQ574_20900 (plasmid) [Stutzerimonas frequens]|uniref:hypothetical protein n=1 Tax=Stutzerimonas frequens TaxID=2968969 RepID=UPI002DBAA432|nr:hypothetical protein [Stutzerimonas frequens]WRW29399.1 hypothetical protein VQ574_20900 [Stutzerimonas frequens]
MSGNDDSLAPEQSSAPLTSTRLHNMVLEHMLENPSLFILGDKPELNAVEHFKNVLDSMVSLAHQIATESLVNRQHLSALPTLDGSIGSDPDTDETGQRYELRYRLVEQIGNESPYKDSVMTAKEAQDIYGDSFIDNYWGRLGEHCPRRVTTPGNRTLWFSVVRFPVLDQMSHGTKNSSSSVTPGLR